MKKLILILFLVASVFGQVTRHSGWVQGSSSLDHTGNLLVYGNLTLHADMYFDENTTAQTPTAGDTIGIRYMTQGIVRGFSFDAGSGAAYAAVVQTDTVGRISVVSAGHGLSAGDWITLADGIYDGVYRVTSVHTDTIRVAATFSSTDAGNWVEPSRLTLTQTGISSEVFKINWNMSASVAGSPAGDDVRWSIYVNNIHWNKLEQRRTLTTGSVYGAFGNAAYVTLSTGDDIFMFFLSDDTNALTHYAGCLSIGQQ